MLMRWLCARIRRRFVDSRGSCAMWVDVRYIEPFGVPTWAVRAHGFEHTAEICRGRRLLPTLLRAHRIAAHVAKGVRP